jgi:DNA-binding beta-propeller fold protein YncE
MEKHSKSIFTVVTSEFVRSFIDNTGSSFAQPQGIAAARQFVYVADTMNNVIRFVELASGNVRTLAGNPNSGGNGNNDGTGTLARFYGPTGLVIDSTGQYLYVADSYNHRIRQIQNMTGVVTTIAGSSIGCIDGLGTNAAFRNPRALALDSNNPFLYVADTDNNCIRKVDMTNNNNQVTTLAGNVMSGYSDGFGTNALFDAPTAIAVDPTGNYLVVGDSNNKYVRRIVISTGIVTTMMLSSAFASNPSSPASFSKFTGLVFDLSGSFLFVAEESIITQVAFGSSVSAAKQFGRNNNILAISLDPYTGVNLYASDKVQNKLFQFTPSSPCPSGYSCTQGVATPTLCAIGSYCPAGTSTPSSCSAAGSACCPAGQFLSSGTCQSCSFDSFTSGANTLPYCTSCPAGTRSVNPSGSTACKASSARYIYITLMKWCFGNF